MAGPVLQGNMSSCSRLPLAPDHLESDWTDEVRSQADGQISPEGFFAGKQKFLIEHDTVFHRVGGSRTSMNKNGDGSDFWLEG